MPQSAGAPTGGAGGARSRVKAEAQPIKPSQDGRGSNNYGINGANGDQQVRIPENKYYFLWLVAQLAAIRASQKCILYQKKHYRVTHQVEPNLMCHSVRPINFITRGPHFALLTHVLY